MLKVLGSNSGWGAQEFSKLVFISKKTQQPVDRSALYSVFYGEASKRPRTSLNEYGMCNTSSPIISSLRLPLAASHICWLSFRSVASRQYKYNTWNNTLRNDKFYEISWGEFYGGSWCQLNWHGWQLLTREQKKDLHVGAQGGKTLWIMPQTLRLRKYIQFHMSNRYITARFKA